MYILVRSPALEAPCEAVPQRAATATQGTAHAGSSTAAQPDETRPSTLPTVPKKRGRPATEVTPQRVPRGPPSGARLSSDPSKGGTVDRAAHTQRPGDAAAAAHRSADGTLYVYACPGCADRSPTAHAASETRRPPPEPEKEVPRAMPVSTVPPPTRFTRMSGLFPTRRRWKRICTRGMPRSSIIATSWKKHWRGKRNMRLWWLMEHRQARHGRVVQTEAHPAPD